MLPCWINPQISAAWCHKGFFSFTLIHGRSPSVIVKNKTKSSRAVNTNRGQMDRHTKHLGVTESLVSGACNNSFHSIRHFDLALFQPALGRFGLM